MSSWLNNFSHIYLEREAEAYPLAQKVLKRFSRATVVAVEDYKDIFGRPRQNFQLQKKSSQLILAVKKDALIYAGSSNVQDFGYPNFYYNALALNCVFNCSYCYLQGMYPSANRVLFVNQEDYFAEVQRAIAKRPDKGSPLYLAISYDTDLLAFEKIIPYCREWIDFSRRESNLLIEIRTKSAHFSAIADLDAHPRAVLAWTLSPDAIVERYEKGTPSLQQRLEAVKRALGRGWPLRLCFDPVLPIPGWRAIYSECIKSVFAQIPAERVRDVSLGVFRMNSDYFRRIKKARQDLDILHFPYERRGNNVSLAPSERKSLMEFMLDLLKSYLPEHKIAIWR